MRGHEHWVWQVIVLPVPDRVRGHGGHRGLVPSLMEDQVLGLQSSGISAALLGSAQNHLEKVLMQLQDGMTPEFIT